MPDITVNGVRLHYRMGGPEGAPWVTFSNSLATDLHLWDAQVALLADRFRILRYDTRGHGKSGVTPAPYDFDLLQSDVIGLWDGLGIQESHYVGLSLGGSTGIGLAIHHPGRIASLAACDCRVTAPPAFRQAWEARIAIVRADGMEGLVEETMARWFTAPILAADPPELAKIRSMIGRPRWTVSSVAPAPFRGSIISPKSMASLARPCSWWARPIPRRPRNLPAPCTGGSKAPGSWNFPAPPIFPTSKTRTPSTPR